MTGEQEGGAVRRGKRRGVAPESDTPFSPKADAVHGWEAVRAFRLSVYGLIPGVGLLTGPLAFLLGSYAFLKNRRTPDRKGVPMAKAAMLVGLLLALTQWGGLTLMIRALATN